MASSRNQSQITWSSGAASVTLSSNNTRSTSDAFAFNVEDWDADLMLYADNSGTPAAGDTVDFYIHYTCGDINADASDDYATNEHAEFLCRLDTVAANTPGEDPAAKVIPIRTTASGFKISCEGPQVASRNIVCRARVVTRRPQ
jgi:hypothetical protein